MMMELATINCDLQGNFSLKKELIDINFAFRMYSNDEIKEKFQAFKQKVPSGLDPRHEFTTVIFKDGSMIIVVKPYEELKVMLLQQKTLLLD